MLKTFVAYHQPDVLAITESWGRAELFDSLITPEGYFLFRKDRQDRKGGGVFILVKHSLMPTEYSVDHTSEIPFNDSVWCTVKVSSKISLLIGCIYRSPSSSSGNNASMCSLISKACSSFDGAKLILGDFNCPGIDWNLFSGPPAFQFLLDCCNDNFLHQTVCTPTRDNSILDLVLTNDISFVTETLVEEPFPGSDHNAIRLNLVFDKSDSRPEQNVDMLGKSLDFARADWESYRQRLSSFDKGVLLDVHDVNALWDAIKSVINEAALCSIPLKKKRKFIQGTPLSGDVLRAFRYRKAAYRQTQSSSSRLASDLRDRAEKRLSEAICSSRAAFEKKIAVSCKHDTKRFWKYVKGSLANKARISSVLTSSGLLTEGDLDTAECLNSFFASVFTQEDGDAPIIDCRTNKRLSIINIDVVDVAKVVKRLPNRSSPGPDGITYELVKEGGHSLFSILARFYGILLSKGEIPMEWKHAHVVPIHKKGSLSKCENYRPISLTSCVCKILEAIIKKVLLAFLYENDLLSFSQHGFLPKRSSTTALLDFLEDVSLSLDSESCVDALYLDFQKAFDSVPHKRLIAKLKSYGVSGPLLSWIRAFLINRKQSVKIRGTVSKSARVVSGVPQGSVLGPLLFVIYINDIDDCIQDAQIIKYADDIRLYIAISNQPSPHVGQQLLQDDLTRVSAWSKTWLLNLNTSKCDCLHFGSGNPQKAYVLGDDVLPSSREVCDLGVQITSDLKPSAQCQRAAARANRILGCIRLAFRFLDATSLITLYKALVLPILEYCSVAWCPFYTCDIDVLEKVQRRMTRMLPEVRNLPYEERLRPFNLLTLYARRIRHDLIFTWNLLRGNINLNVSHFFAPAIERRTRGHNAKLQINHSRLNIRKYFYSQRVISHWNNLPSHCVNAPSLSSFKFGLDKYFKDNGIH